MWHFCIASATKENDTMKTLVKLFCGTVAALALAACSSAPAPEDTQSTSSAMAWCVNGHHWNSQLCECVPNCVDTIMCTVGHHWDPEKCTCIPNCFDNVMCMANHHFDSTVCHCVPNACTE
jgi:hypothetical protein